MLSFLFCSMYSTGHVSFSVRIYVLLLYVKILLYIMNGYNLPWLSIIRTTSTWTTWTNTTCECTIWTITPCSWTPAYAWTSPARVPHLHVYLTCTCTLPAHVPRLHVCHLHLHNLPMCHLKAYHLNMYNLHVNHLNTITLKGIVQRKLRWVEIGINRQLLF